MRTELYYTAAGNTRFVELAIAAGWQYGARLPHVVYFAPAFVDQEYKAPDFVGYMAALAQHKPRLATVLDWEAHVPLAEVLRWAEEAAAHVETVIVIPKLPGRVQEVPHVIGGKPVRLGYSVKTQYGCTPCHPAEFGERPVHLLGGSPQRQMRLSTMMRVVSADNNMIQERATHNAFWVPGNATTAKNRYFPQLQEAGGYTGTDAPYEAFARSCANVMAAWRKLLANDYSDLPMWSANHA